MTVTSKQAIKQSSKKTDFTADLIWWGSLRLAPIIIIIIIIMMMMIFGPF